MTERRTLVALLLAAAVTACGGGDAPKGGSEADTAAAPAKTTRLAFSGGPEGGTFQYFSNGMSIRLSKSIPGLEVSNTASAGSLENLRRVNSGEADFGIVYSGDTYLGRNGKLTQDENKYENVHALAFLYGAPAHLVVLADGGINSVADLAGKRVAVGGAGSGAAERRPALLHHPRPVGQDEGRVPRLQQGRLGAGRQADRRLLGLRRLPQLVGDPGRRQQRDQADRPGRGRREGGLLRGVPVLHPADHPGRHLQRRRLRRRLVPGLGAVGGRQGTSTPDIVYAALAEIYSDEGLAYMVKVKSTAKSMSVASGLDGIVTPIHAGAERFWTENGLTITPEQSAR